MSVFVCMKWTLVFQFERHTFFSTILSLLPTKQKRDSSIGFQVHRLRLPQANKKNISQWELRHFVWFIAISNWYRYFDDLWPYIPSFTFLNIVKYNQYVACTSFYIFRFIKNDHLLCLTCSSFISDSRW